MVGITASHVRAQPLSLPSAHFCVPFIAIKSLHSSSSRNAQQLAYQEEEDDEVSSAWDQDFYIDNGYTDLPPALLPSSLDSPGFNFDSRDFDSRGDQLEPFENDSTFPLPDIELARPPDEYKDAEEKIKRARRKRAKIKELPPLPFGELPPDGRTRYDWRARTLNLRDHVRKGKQTSIFDVRRYDSGQIDTGFAKETKRYSDQYVKSWLNLIADV